jgi:uncharacterized protein
MMKLPCEEAMWYTLPMIRSDLARELISLGLSQKEAAEKLGVTPSAVSQYLHKKRGDGKKMPEEYGVLIRDVASEILTSNDDSLVMGLVCKCCKQSRKI